MYCKYKSLIIVCCFLTTLSKHFLIETDNDISSTNPDGPKDYDEEFEDYEDGDYEDLYVGNDPDIKNEGCDRDRVQCKVIEVSGDTRNYANGKYKPAKTGPHGTRYKNTKRQRFMIVSDKRNKFLLALMNTDENKPGFKILTTGKHRFLRSLTFKHRSFSQTSKL